MFYVVKTVRRYRGAKTYTIVHTSHEEFMAGMGATMYIILYGPASRVECEEFLSDIS